MLNFNTENIEGRKGRASRLLFENLIDINRRTGVITLDSKRMLLISAEAMGMLRRDLVSTLGMERTKSFLMRYGWSNGLNDGEALGEMFEWESLTEYINSGPVLATLEGIVTVEPDVLEVNEDKFYSRGFWKNSFEAEEHIRHFGFSDEPVCYTLVGYASGFLTKAFGKRVVVKETHCKAMGDDHCYFEAVSIDDETDYHSELRFYQAESLASELDTLYKEKQELYQIMARAEIVNNELTDLMLQGKSLNELIHHLANILQRSIVIDQVNKDDLYEAVWYNDFDMESYNVWRSTSEQKGPQYSCEPFKLMASNQLLGRMVIVGSVPLGKQDVMIVERTVSVIKTYLYFQQSINKWNWKTMTDLFKELRQENFDEQGVKKRISRLGIDLSSVIRVVCMKIMPSQHNEAESILHILIKKFPFLHAFISKDRIIILLSEKHKQLIVGDENQRLEDENAETVMLKLLKSSFPHTQFFIGIGRSSTTPAELGKSYEDSFLITDFMSLSFSEKNVVARFEELEPIMLFVRGVNHQDFFSFCNRVIGKLIEHDKTYQSNLIVSLKSYLDNSGNLANTARDLHLSIAGLRYRISRIEDLCGINLSDGINRFNFHLAIQIYFTLQLLNKNS